MLPFLMRRKGQLNGMLFTGDVISPLFDFALSTVFLTFAYLKFKPDVLLLLLQVGAFVCNRTMYIARFVFLFHGKSGVQEKCKVACMSCALVRITPPVLFT